MNIDCLEQIKHWYKTCVGYEKAIKRKNKRINSLQRENIALKAKVNSLMLLRATANYRAQK